MICIVNVVPEVVKNETKAVAVPGAQPAQPDNPNAYSENENFGDKLKECEAEGLCEKSLENESESDGDRKDNGMPDPGSEVTLWGIAGILEGFEPPGYQSVNTTICGDRKPAQEGSAIVQKQYSAEQDTIKQSGIENNKSGLTEQIAWMLQMEQNGKKPAPTQDEILRIIDGYLDSLENTSAEADKTGMPLEAGISGETGPAGTDSNDLFAVKTGAAVSEEDVAGIDLEKSGDVLTRSVAGTVNGTAAGETPDVDTKATDAEAADIKGTDTKTADINAADTKTVDIKAAKGADAETADTTANLKDAGVVTAGNAGTTQGTAVPVGASAETAGAPVEDGHIQENITRIVDRVSAQTSEGQCDFDIELKPEFMGKVNIRLSLKDGSVKVQIRADDIKTQEMLSSQTNCLQDMLKAKGIPVSEIDVMCKDSMPDFIGHDFRQQSGEAGSERGSGRGSYYQPETKDNISEPMEMYDFFYGGSSFEFLV